MEDVAAEETPDHVYTTMRLVHIMPQSATSRASSPSLSHGSGMAMIL